MSVRPLPNASYRQWCAPGRGEGQVKGGAGLAGGIVTELGGDSLIRSAVGIGLKGDYLGRDAGRNGTGHAPVGNEYLAPGGRAGPGDCHADGCPADATHRVAARDGGRQTQQTDGRRGVGRVIRKIVLPGLAQRKADNARCVGVGIDGVGIGTAGYVGPGTQAQARAGAGGKGELVAAARRQARQAVNEQAVNEAGSRGAGAIREKVLTPSPLVVTVVPAGAAELHRHPRDGWLARVLDAVVVVVAPNAVANLNGSRVAQYFDVAHRRGFAEPAVTPDAALHNKAAFVGSGRIVEVLEAAGIYVGPGIRLYVGEPEVDFLHAARLDEVITTTAELVRAGKNVIHAEGRIVAADGKLIAKATTNLIQTSVKLLG